MKNNSLKILISGYYGHDNFGDEAILKAFLSEVQNNFESSSVTVISNNPEATKSLYQVDSVYKYDFFGILKEIFVCDIFVSGGGSLFQDTTSFRSLLYYLSLLFTAILFNKKTFVYAQGVGPLERSFARFLTTFVLKKVDNITVRDTPSAQLLNSMGIKSTITADPVWGLESNQNKLLTSSDIKLGIQLRKWKSLNSGNLNTIADAVVSNFSDAEIFLISLNPPDDTAIMQDLKALLKQKGITQEIKIITSRNIEQIISCINSMDLMITMRYHAGLICGKFGVPFIALAYDPKVQSLAEDLSVPCLHIDDLNFDQLDTQIKHLLAEKCNIKSNLNRISTEKAEKVMENIDLLFQIYNSHKKYYQISF